MPMQIVRNDITKMRVDAIVNAANSTLLGGGGVDGAIHRAAGPGLLAECRTLGGCETGEAKLTGGYELPCKYVIHTVGPIWQDGKRGEREQLAACYRNSLELARKSGCETVAFPLISAGAYGYPKDEALSVAVRAIGDFLSENEMTVYVVIFDKAAYNIGKALFADIEAYIDDRYAEEHEEPLSVRLRRQGQAQELFSPKVYGAPSLSEASLPEEAATPKTLPKKIAERLRRGRKRNKQEEKYGELPKSVSLDEALRKLDESFSQMLLRKIDERGLTDVQCYKKANIDRKLFSKIRSDTFYKPSKPTALAFAIALELSLDETQALLRTAGFALSHSSKFDIIIEYFIEHGNYNVFEINEALFAFDQSLLGA